MSTDNWLERIALALETQNEIQRHHMQLVEQVVEHWARAEERDEQYRNSEGFKARDRNDIAIARQREEALGETIRDILFKDAVRKLAEDELKRREASDG